MNKKNIIKFILFISIATVIFILAILFGLSNLAKGIFVSEENNNTIADFGRMIISPTQTLEGEDKGQINILLLGVGGEGHSGGELTDTIMVLSIKPETKEAAIISIPRDLYVETENPNISGKINSIQEQGDNSSEKNGNELLRNVIEDISGFHIDYFLQTDFEAFIQTVDYLDGIDVYIEETINDPTYPNFSRGYDPFYIEKGWHHLDGSTALKVARSRHSTMGDFDRIKRQQEIIKAIKQKFYEKYEKADVTAFANILISLSQHIKTDFEPKDIPRLFQLFKEIKNNNFSIQTLDTKNYLDRIYVGLGYTLGLSEENQQQTQQLSQNAFNLEISEEEKEDILEENTLIEIQNATSSPDIANKISADLESLGLKIIKTSNIENAETTGVEINYKENTDKTETLDFLAEIFDAKTFESLEESYKADIIITLGKGF